MTEMNIKSSGPVSVDLGSLASAIPHRVEKQGPKQGSEALNCKFQIEDRNSKLENRESQIEKPRFKRQELVPTTLKASASAGQTQDFGPAVHCNRLPRGVDSVLGRAGAMPAPMTHIWLWLRRAALLA
jgi:hypothetical protein